MGDPGTAPAAYPPRPLLYPRPPALGQTVTPPGHHSHDGFFLRMQLGLGYTSVSAENADLEISGSSGHFLMAAGAALAGKLVLYGEFGAGTVTEPSVTVDNQSGSFDGELTVFTFGVGAAYYIMPANVYLSATLGGSQVELEVRNGLDVAQAGEQDRLRHHPQRRQGVVGVEGPGAGRGAAAARVGREGGHPRRARHADARPGCRWRSRAPTTEGPPSALYWTPNMYLQAAA